MRISDWSSDVCSSDLRVEAALPLLAHGQHLTDKGAGDANADQRFADEGLAHGRFGKHGGLRELDDHIAPALAVDSADHARIAAVGPQMTQPETVALVACRRRGLTREAVV